MTMEDGIRSAVAQAVERFAAYIGPPLPSSSSSSSRFSSLANCDTISRINVKARWLIRMLAWVRATLDDAEDMDIREESVRDWLRELQAVAGATEDVLDELPHEALRLGLMDMSRPHQVHSSSSVTPLRQLFAFLRRVEQMMECIVSRFVTIKKPEHALKLEYFREEQIRAESVSTGRTTSSVMEEPHIVGRHEELAKIKQFLLPSDAEEESRGSGGDMDDDHVSVMAIVGMGGLGKTTLAQLAYNDAQVNKHFQLKSWVCVSEDFDVIRLTKAISQSLNVEASGLTELDPLQRHLLQKLNGKERFLLALDDVWEADSLHPSSWNLLTAPLRNRSADTKIIITTRSSKVPDVAPRTWTYDLGFLTIKDTLELFMQHAFEGRDPNLCQNLVVTGKEIAGKCRGVPLAAKTLGGLLCTKDDDEWNKILDNEVWNAVINQEDSIIPILRLSYLHLSAPLKRCFRYCSLFPKDCVFDRNEMILMWMAQGYIRANRRKLMEDIGQRYIDNLVSRSFFQKHPFNSNRLQMHDLMHDLARCVSGDECYSMEGDKSCSIPSHVRHLSVSPTRDSHGTRIWSRNNISDPKSLRSFILPDKDLWYSFSGHDLPSYLYTRMEHLRVMDLGGVRLSCLPKSIARLKHLRFLRIFLSVEALPESVGSMYHLQTLDLGQVSARPESVGSMYHLQTLDLGQVSELPKSISNLHNLRHLILNTRHCVRYPVGIGKLTDLQTVPGFCVSPNHSSSGKLGELKAMNNIRGEFAIEGLENLSDVNEAKMACLDKKKNIRSLHLRWDHRSASSHIDDKVLESLKPSVKLARLQISGFKGPSYPFWLGDRSFTRLVSIRLEHCPNCTFLPPLGQLPLLKSLYISKARAVQYIGSEFFSGGFPQLEELALIEMDNWKSWCGVREGECPKLKNLSIVKCPKLESLSLINLAAVEGMYVSIFESSLELSYLQRAKRIEINMTIGSSIKAHLSPAAPLEDEPHLQLMGVGQREAEYILAMCSHICSLTVQGCSNLTCLPLDNYSALKYVEIGDCPYLQITSVSPQLWQLPSLQRIHVHRIHGAVSITVLEKSHLEFTNVDQLVASVLVKVVPHICQLTVKKCPNLTSLPLGNQSALKDVEISDCPQLRITSLFRQLWQLPSLQRIDVNGIHGAVSIKVVRESYVELTNVNQLVAFALLKKFSHMIRQLITTNCANLTSLPWTDLTTLEYLRISECPLFQLLDAEQLPSTLQVLCIYGNLYETEQCSRHPHFQRLKQVRQCSNKEGGEHNLYLVFRNVHDASAASKFCSVNLTEIHTLDVEWDCCTNDRSNVADAITQEVLFNLYSLCISSKRLVIRGYIGSGFAGCYADFSSKTLRIDVLHSRLSYVSLLQCSKCDLAPLSGLPILQELYVEGASSLESVALDCLFPYDDMSEGERKATHTSIAFPTLQKLEFHDMPVWKEWLGTKEGDFPFLWKLVLNQCPRLRALPHLPPGLKELILEGCEELQSLSSSSQGLKSLKSLWRLSVANCPNLDFTATEGPPPRLELLSLTGCPLLLAWCEGHPRMLASLNYLLVDGVRVSTENFTSLD